METNITITHAAHPEDVLRFLRASQVRETMRGGRRSAPWTPTRRAADWAFRYVIPGRHYSFTNSLEALMRSRETAP